MGKDLPQSGRAALQARISQLRRALGTGAARLVTMSAGYALEVEPDELDLRRFERLVAESGRAEPERAVRDAPRGAGVVARQAAGRRLL